MSGTPLPGGPVRAVLFDYGLTLVTYRRPDAALLHAYAGIARLLAEHLAVDAPDAERLVREVHDRVDTVVSRHDASTSLEEVDLVPEHAAAYRALGLDVPADLLDEVMRLEQLAWFEGMQVGPGTVATLRRLREHGLRLAVVSNAPYRPASLHEQLRHLGLAPLLDGAVFSSEVGWRKPAAAIFERALESLAAAPDETVMVGDRVREDVAGGQAVGMRAVRMREHHDDRDPDGTADAVVDRIGDLLPLLAPLAPRPDAGRGTAIRRGSKPPL